MHKPLLILLLILSSSCASKKQFSDKDVCFLLYDLKKDKYVEVMNETRCGRRYPAVSTFKVPLAIMAIDKGIVQAETSPVFKWSGERSIIESWNKNQTPTSWVRDSVIWVSQEITSELGTEAIKKYLDSFDYGNADDSAGLKYFWLTPAPFVLEPMANSLRISAHEQVSFLKRLWRRELNTSFHSQELTPKLMTHDISSKGSVLIGKTGSGFTDENMDRRLGWYIGHLQSEDQEYILVINFTDKQKTTVSSFGGREAKEIALELLHARGLW